MKLIYIAGPYRDERGEWYVRENIRFAERMALEVWKLGAVAICPHKNTASFGGYLPDWRWLEGDKEIILRCDAVWAVGYWERSDGTISEIEFARARGIEVILSYDRLKEFIAE